MSRDIDLILDPRQRQWFVVIDGAAYLIDAETEIVASASHLPVTVLEKSDDAPLQIGNATLDSVDGALHLNLVTTGDSEDGPDTDLIVFGADQVRMHSCLWAKGRPANDRWVMADAILSIENIRQLRITAFVPKVDDEEMKELRISSKSGYSERVTLVRGKTTTFDLIPPYPGQHRLRFHTTPEPSSRDRRVLGFILAQMDVHTDQSDGSDSP